MWVLRHPKKGLRRTSRPRPSFLSCSSLQFTPHPRNDPPGNPAPSEATIASSACSDLASSGGGGLAAVVRRRLRADVVGILLSLRPSPYFRALTAFDFSLPPSLRICISPLHLQSCKGCSYPADCCCSPRQSITATVIRHGATVTSTSTFYKPHAAVATRYPKAALHADPPADIVSEIAARAAKDALEETREHSLYARHQCPLCPPGVGLKRNTCCPPRPTKTRILSGQTATVVVVQTIVAWPFDFHDKM